MHLRSGADSAGRIRNLLRAPGNLLVRIVREGSDGLKLDIALCGLRSDRVNMVLRAAESEVLIWMDVKILTRGSATYTLCVVAKWRQFTSSWVQSRHFLQEHTGSIREGGSSACGAARG